VLVVVACTFRSDARCSLAWVWNWARPVLEGDRSSCTNRLIVTVSFPGRACHPLTVEREGMAMTIVESARLITGGVDTHLDVHVAAAVDANGGVLGVESFATTPGGYGELHGWLAGFGTVDRVGVEGTGAYGAGLARHLRGRGLVVIEVDRPNRQERRRNGKSDELDAIEAARAALSGRASGIAKSADGDVEAIRALLVARRSGRNVRIKYMNQIRHLGFTAPDELRERLRDVPADQLARTAAALRPTAGGDTVVYATKLAIATLGRRIVALETDARRLDEILDTLVRRRAPRLLEVYGVGIHTAAILLVAAGDNPHRLKSEAAFAHLCGVAPLPASSGKTQRRFRLNPGGNRQANHALWRIVFTRMSSDERTRKYVARRLAEGRSTREIMRILKRYVARELYPHLIHA
jgi:transposase